MRHLTTIIVLVFSCLAYGQEQHGTTAHTNSHEPHHQPALILKIKSINYPLDSMSIRKINPKWIKQVEIVKEIEGKYIFGNNSNVVFVYPKQKFYKQAVSALAEHGKLVVNNTIATQMKKQESVIRAGIGFGNYKLDTTTLLQLVADFGTSYELIKNERESIYILEYKKLGLTFYFDEGRSDALLKKIEFRKPFLGITETGIRLGDSKMLDVKDAHGDLDWYTTEGSKYWWSEHPGIEFGVLRDLRLPQYPLDEDIHEQKKIIEITVLKTDEYK